MKTTLKSLLILCMLFAFTGLQAQVKFGPKVGMNLSTMTIKSSGISFDPKMLVGFHAGVVSEIGLTDNLKLQPGILYSSKGSKYELTLFEESFDFSLAPAFIEVPVNLLYSFGPGDTKFNVFAGPYFAYGIGGKFKSDGESEDIIFGTSEDDDMKPLDIGVNFGVGVNIKGFLISAQYGLGLANLTTEDTGDTEMKNKVIGISVGYLFGAK